MANIHVGRVLTDAIIYSLTSAGLVVGDAVKPEGATAATGYVVVYPLPGGVLDGTIGRPDDDASVIYQVTAIGSTRQKCEWVADRARVTLLAASLPIGDNRRVVRIMVDMLGGTMRDDDVQPFVLYSPDRYRIETVAAA